jgi:hypothetical protein
MEPFSPELLTILVLAALSWAGVTFIGVIVGFIVFICISRSKHRRDKHIYPTKTRSTASSISIDNHPPSIQSIIMKNPIIPIQKQEPHKPRHDQSYSSSNQKNKYKQQEYINDDTTSIVNESRKTAPRHQRQQYRPIKPTTDVGFIDRHTPYPPDVIAREKFMYNIRFPGDEKY